jgi:hypothetical protein
MNKSIKSLCFALVFIASLFFSSHAATICVVSNPDCAAKVSACRKECKDNVVVDGGYHNNNILVVCYQICRLLDSLCS